MRKFCLADKTVNSFVIAVYMPMMCWRNGVLVNWKNDDLFSDAELREYGFEDLFRDDVLPGDAAQMADDLTDLFAQQVGRKVVAQTVEGGAQGFGRRRQGFVMAAVGDDRAAVVERFRIDRVAQDPAQVVDAVAVACRDADGAFGKCETGCFVDFVVYRQQRLVGTERKVRALGVGGRIGARNRRGGFPARLSG